MLNWSEPYEAIWKFSKVDEATWAEAETVANVQSAKVTRTADGDLLEAGSVVVDAGEFETGYYRLVMVARAETGDFERVEVATMLFEGEGREYDHGTYEQTANGRSVLYPASVRVLIDGTYAPAGTDGAAFAAKLLGQCVKAPISVEASFTLNNNIVFKFGSSVLEAAWEVLRAGGAFIRITGDGVIHIMSLPSVPALNLDSANASILGNGIKSDIDISEVPNRYIAVGEFETAIAVNDDAESLVSTVSRGYIHDFLDESPEPVNGETLERYAQRRLQEESTVGDTRTYSREWWPDVYPYDLVLGSMESVSLSGAMRVVSQSLNCGYGIWVTEKARKEVSLWKS